MRASKFFISTLKEAPSEAEVISHKLMLRAGLIKRLTSGVYTWMPLGLRVLRKVETITSAMHNLVEKVQISTPQGVQTGYVMATNVYQRTAQGWRMVAHHASPGTQAEVTDIVSAPTTLH